MRPRESARRLIGALLLLALTLLGGSAWAAAVMPEAGPVTGTAMASTTQMPSMADMFDCAPCVACYVAPAPSLHAAGGEPREPDEPSWPMHAAAVPATLDACDSGGRRARMPVRIAFCRWLD